MEDKLSMHACINLQKKCKEYNKEFKTNLSFCQWMRLMQYTKEDITTVMNTMIDNNKKNEQMRKEQNKLIVKIRSIVPPFDYFKEFEQKGFGRVKENGKWKWSKPHIFNKWKPAYLQTIYDKIKENEGCGNPYGLESCKIY